MTQETINRICEWLHCHAGKNASLRVDSRLVEPGDVFVAVRGHHVDGLDFAEQALAQGAAAVVSSPREKNTDISVAYLEIADLEDNLGLIADAFYGHPSRHMTGIAVTGTNGKTSSCYWLARLLSRIHHPCAMIGTLGCWYMEKYMAHIPNTTPEPIALQTLFAELYDQGCQCFAMEASSIGLVQGRLQGSSLRCALFTNLTRDHLDYHQTMQAYEHAKSLLFSWSGLEHAVINADDPAGCRFLALCQREGVPAIAYTLGAIAVPAHAQPLRALHVREGIDGMHFDLCWQGQTIALHVRVLGRFNVSNLLGVAGVLLSLGIPLTAVCNRLQQLDPPPGRLQMIRAENRPLAVVDYAHTPDALEKALQALRPIADIRGGRLWIVFGAGGDRDGGKRIPMGEVAARLSDESIITNDNPRTEDPFSIAEAICEGVRKVRRPRVILDRAAAIRTALLEANPKDIVLIAGKGHEDYQDVGGVKHHFSDKEEAEKVLGIAVGENNEQ